MARALGKRLVIATATVALQEQLVGQGPAGPAGGQRPRLRLRPGQGASALPLPEPARPAAGAPGDPVSGGMTLGLYPTRRRCCRDSRGDGYLRSHARCPGSRRLGRRSGQLGRGPVDDADWFAVTADQGQCTGRRCPNIGQCSFYRARDRLQNADVVVTNHDLVLSDLALGGGVILPAPGGQHLHLRRGPPSSGQGAASFCRLLPRSQHLASG
jgi:ATP-dependent DNA helicase DinG